MEGLNYYIITHAITGVTAIVFGLMVFWQGKKKLTNIVFGLLCFAVATWAISYAIWLLQNNESDALFWARTLNMAAIFIPVFYLHWVINFLKIKPGKLLVFSYILTALFVLFSYSDYFIRGVVQVFEFPFWPQAGWLFVLFLVVGWCMLVSFGMFLLFKKLKSSKGIIKLQIEYVIVGSLIGFVGGSMNFPLMFGLEWFPPLGSALVIAFPIVFSLSMIRHQLMDIKFVLRRSTVYFLSIISVIGVAVLIKYLVGLLLGPEGSFWSEVIALSLAVLIFTPIRDFFYRTANKYFFSSLYDSRELITEISDKLRETLIEDSVYKLLDRSLEKTLRPTTFGGLSFDEIKKEYVIEYDHGFNAGHKTKFPGNQWLYDNFIKKNLPLVVEELKVLHYNRLTRESIDLMESIGVELLIPLNIKGKSVGLLALGPKESREMYNSEDLRVLNIIAAQVATTIESARLYKEAKEFNIKLKKEVDDATFNLQEANKELKGMNRKLGEAYDKLHKLDRAKSEFLSIASHQLRTPLTSIKGFTSLLLEGTYGKTSSTIKDILEKIFISNERLIKLVEDLLNISRIESGRIAFDFEKNDLTELAEEVIGSMQIAAKNKKLKLELRKSKKKLPAFYFDRSKIREVISNFVDNSIKYTKKGTVAVEIKNLKNKVQLTVVDTGIGIRKGEAGYIFEKFQRGEDISKINTEGAGLGLYVCRKIIEAHDGKIWAESDGLNKGSRFIFELKKDLQPPKRKNKEK